MASPHITANGSTLDVHIVDCESPKSLYTLCEASTPQLTTTTPLTSSSTGDNFHEDEESSGDDEGVTYACHEYSEDEEADKEAGLPEKEVCEGDPSRVFTGGDDTQAPGCGSCWCCSSNAESVCEGRDFPKDTCLSIGCCQWDGEEEECYSAVGRNPCRATPPPSAAVHESENGTVELGSGEYVYEYEYEYEYEEGSSATEEEEEEGGADCTGGNSCCSPTNTCSGLIAIACYIFKETTLSEN